MTAMSKPRFGKTLVVGGTGMLGDVSRYLAEKCAALTLGARQPQDLARTLGAAAFALDWQDRQQAGGAIAQLGEFDLLVSWLHDDGCWMAEHLERHLNPAGRSIRVHGAKSKDPAQLNARNTGTRSDIVRQTVILGWVNDPDGRRWLNNDEICKSVISAIDDAAGPVIICGTLDD